jgi:very-short-patch-repair endonuclease
MAAVLACGPGALLSHRSAGAHHGLLGYLSARIDVTVVGRGPRPGIVVHRVRQLPDDDRALVDNIPVTSVARTLCDLAGAVRADQLRRAIDPAERSGGFDLRAFNRRRVPRALHAALAGYCDCGFTRSELERRFARLCRDAGLRPPSMNMWIHGQEVDALWEEEKVAVQLDTYEFHGTPAAFEDDRRRDAVLQVAGYSVLRVTGRWLDDDPAGVAATVRSLLTSSSSATEISTSSPNVSRSAIAS